MEMCFGLSPYFAASHLLSKLTNLERAFEPITFIESYSYKSMRFAECLLYEAKARMYRAHASSITT